MAENASVSNNCGIVDFNHHLVAEQEPRMSGSGGSNSGGTSIGNATASVGTVSVLLPSGGGGSGTKRRSAVGSNSSHNVGGSASNSASISADLASLFECPVCFDYVLPPILQCQSGHLV